MNKAYFLIFFSIINNCIAMEKPVREAKDIIRIKNIITLINATSDSYKIYHYTEKKFPQGSIRINFVEILPNQEKKIVIVKSPFAPLSLEINEIDSNFIPLLTLNTYSLCPTDNYYSGYLTGKPKTICEEYRNLVNDTIALAHTIKSELILKGENLRDSQFHFIAKIPTSK